MIERPVTTRTLAWRAGACFTSLAIALAASACSGGGDSPAAGSNQGITSGNGAASGDASAADAAPASDAATIMGGCDMPSQAYTAGMSQKGSAGAFTFEIVTINGDALNVGTDTWTIKLTDASGQPVDGATFTVKAWMPEHGHGWTAATVAGQGGGVYEIDNLYLFMPGFWQITITATTGAAGDAGSASDAGATTDSTVFTFCLD